MPLGLPLVTATTAFIWAGHPSIAQDKGKTPAAELASESQAALQKLYGSAELAKQLGPKAQAILVFPKVTKAGLGIGGQYGEGALLKGGNAVAYYKTTGASFGLQRRLMRAPTRRVQSGGRCCAEPIRRMRCR